MKKEPEIYPDLFEGEKDKIRKKAQESYHNFTEGEKEKKGSV